MCLFLPFHLQLIILQLIKLLTIISAKIHLPFVQICFLLRRGNQLVLMRLVAHLYEGSQAAIVSLRSGGIT